MKRLLMLAVPLLLAGGIASAGIIVDLGTFSVNSQSTYLRTNNDSPVAPLFINLTTLPLAVTPGAVLTLTTVGDYCVMGGAPCQEWSEPLGAVFSSQGPGSLLATNVVNRLPGALTTSGVPDSPDPNTWYGNLTTAIPQDFQVPTSAYDVTVPVGATWLVVGVLDSYYCDNSDPNHNLGINIKVDPETLVPEPASYALFLAGLGGLAVWRRVRFHHS
jgi:hypothetical protein